MAHGGPDHVARMCSRDHILDAVDAVRATFARHGFEDAAVVGRCVAARDAPRVCIQA